MNRVPVLPGWRISGAAASLLVTAMVSLPPGSGNASELIERDIEYRVAKGDNGNIIEGRLGMDWKQIALDNSLDPSAPLGIGQVLKVRFSRIVPERIENGIIINIPDRTLYRFENGRLRDYFFISPGKPTWQTPLGEFVIKAKATDPVWLVPPSIQREMEEEGKDVLVEVPPGPENPLGKHWLQLSIRGIGLHGTNAPQSIYKFRSHGCMRLRPDVAELLFRELPVGTNGKIIYRAVKAFRSPEGRVYIEVYNDFYRKGNDHIEEARRLLNEINAGDVADWDKIEEAIRMRDGRVRDVTRGTQRGGKAGK